MRDVAAAVGVSSMTVSNVLTGRRRVSAETRRRVLAEVQRSGYQVNVAARSLRQGRTGVVGLAVHELDSHYFAMLAAAVVARLSREGLRVVVEQTGASREGELAAITDSRANAYDGLILSASDLGPADVAALVGDLPVVMLGERQDLERFDHVEMANADGAEAAARLLLEQGCRRLAAIGMPPPDRGQDPSGGRDDAFLLRARGVARAVAAHPGARVVPVETTSTRLAAGAALVGEALRLQPDTDGFVCATDTLALGVLRGLADRGLRVPGDALVVGFDDVPDAAFSNPSLSTVAPGHEEMVEATARLLLRRMADRDAPPERVVADFTLVRRESTGHAPSPLR
ncbi:LacI family DNA-binding transcriptional regulator [Kineococcus sp. SYSU DK004]|uniref:LacI family DNA-binding transcriptional regulator n=1 Tax=Kineococcus sp. SYSU DK004 TaxID=3383125 RepID=UPI003D7EA700